MMAVYKYGFFFLAGACIVLIAMLKFAKPVINTSTYVDKLEQSVKKLKQRGEGNEQSVTPVVSTGEATNTEADKAENKKPKKLIMGKRRIYK